MKIYNMIKTLINKGRVDGLKEKVDVFFLTNSLTEEEYKELTELLTQE